ncbi:MAG: septum formation initiator family protein [Solirubrobacteraceae bacterium]
MAEFAPRVRWDRVGRMTLIVVGLLLVYLYINPLRTWVSTWQEAKTKRGEVSALQREHQQLVQRKRALQASGAVDTEARRLGMVRRDERAFVVRGLPREGE